jgi:glycerophosphoryl diester phosphodiesterase
VRLRREDGVLLRIGHRGAAALEPENTLASLERAVELGVDLVELDVLAREDGTLVLAHSGDVAGPDAATFGQALAFFRERAPGTGIHVDLKLRGGGERVVEALRRHGLLGRTFVSSFSVHALHTVAVAAPGLPLGLSYPEHARPYALVRQALHWRIADWLERAGAAAAVLDHRVVSGAVVDRCHVRGAAVIAWTVDDPVRVMELDEIGVDGVVTNDPSVFLATLTT